LPKDDFSPSGFDVGWTPQIQEHLMFTVGDVAILGGSFVIVGWVLTNLYDGYKLEKLRQLLKTTQDELWKLQRKMPIRDSKGKFAKRH
jgi:hypothetical protein